MKTFGIAITLPFRLVQASTEPEVMKLHGFKILIVDDEPLAREGLRMLLSEDPEISSIHEAKNG